ESPAPTPVQQNSRAPLARSQARHILLKRSGSRPRCRPTPPAAAITRRASSGERYLRLATFGFSPQLRASLGCGKSSICAGAVDAIPATFGLLGGKPNVCAGCDFLGSGNIVASAIVVLSH